MVANKDKNPHRPPNPPNAPPAMSGVDQQLRLPQTEQLLTGKAALGEIDRNAQAWERQKKNS